MKLWGHLNRLLMLISLSVCLASPVAAKDVSAKDDDDPVSTQRVQDDAAKDDSKPGLLEDDSQHRRRRHGRDGDKPGKPHHDKGEKPGCYAECHASCASRSDGVTAAMCEQSCARFCGGYGSKEPPRPGHPHHPPRPPPHYTVPGIYYGAIAIAPSRLVYATNTGTLTQTEAEQNALQACRQQMPEWPDDCRIALWFRGTCAALAIQDDPQRVDWGWAAAWGTGKPEAEAQAQIKCNSHTTRKACVVVTSVCAR